jgi:hypothetical protein
LHFSIDKIKDKNAALKGAATKPRPKQKQDAALKGGARKAKLKANAATWPYKRLATQARINDLGFLRAQIIQRGERGGGGQGMFGGLFSGGDRTG